MRICSEVLGGRIHSETRIEEKVTMIRSEVLGGMIRSEVLGGMIRSEVLGGMILNGVSIEEEMTRIHNEPQIEEEMTRIHNEPQIEEEMVRIHNEPRIEMIQTQWLFILANQNYQEEMSRKLQYHVCVVIIITRLLHCMTMKGIRSITRCL